MHINSSTFNISLIHYNTFEILINVTNLKIDYNINLKEIIELIKSNYQEIDIEFKNFKTNTKDFSVILKINKDLFSDVIDPENNHLYYLNKYNDTLSPNLFLKYNIIGISIVGLIIKEILLKEYHITFFTHIHSIKNIYDKINDYDKLYYDLEKYKTDKLPIVDPRAKLLIQKLISKSVHDKKSIGGSLETIIYNVPKRLGTPYFNLFESTISKYLYLIPNLKALEFSNVFEVNNLLISVYKNLCFESDKLKYDTNIFLGVEQGITTGDTICYNTHFLPPLTFKNTSTSINYKTLETVIIKKNNLEYFNLHKYIFIVEALSSIAIYELITKQAY